VSTDTGKAGIFYRSCMDTASINKLGATPLKPYLGKKKCSFLFFFFEDQQAAGHASEAHISRQQILKIPLHRDLI
jgi:predicted metalloendopeptidase